MKIFYSAGIYLYGALIALAALFNRKARMLWRGQRGALRELRRKADPSKEYVWVHAASLGEFEQGRPIIERLKSEHPDTPVLLTFFSPSGYEVRKNYAGADVVAYLPLDTPRAAAALVRTVRLSKAIFIKYEFWPNFLLALQRAGVPTYIVSAIFRPDQLFFRPYGKWYLGLLGTFRHIFVQNEASARLLREHGIDRVSVAGDTRFDRVAAQARMAREFPLVQRFCEGSRVIVAGSTWPHDEALLADYLHAHEGVKLIMVPHEVHKAHLYDLFKLLGGDYVRYSEATDVNILTSRCLVVDVVGILSSLYRYADVAYVGGGFGVGIHNTLEAAVYGVPVVFGPNYRKFREACELVAAGGGFSVNDYEGLAGCLDMLLDNGAAAGKTAGEYVSRNTGATDTILKELN